MAGFTALQREGGKGRKGRGHFISKQEYLPPHGDMDAPQFQAFVLCFQKIHPDSTVYQLPLTYLPPF